MKSLILYWSSGGNTLKVAEAIQKTLAETGVPVDILKMTEDLNVDLYAYDLVFLGAPSIQWIPPLPVQKFIKNTMDRYRGGVRPIDAPKKSGKFGVVFCTFSGVHTGIKEGQIAGKYMAQFFEHIGFLVLDEWYVPGKFQGWEEGSKYGKLGDITQRPDQMDLKVIENCTQEILQGLEFLR
jgi:flavodoxin